MLARSLFKEKQLVITLIFLNEAGGGGEEEGVSVRFWQFGLAVIAVISGFTCKRGERVNSALY